MNHNPAIFLAIAPTQIPYVYCKQILQEENYWDGQTVLTSLKELLKGYFTSTNIRDWELFIEIWKPATSY